jgi:hypothetical protein
VSKTFCILPFTHLQVKNGGTFGMCCNAPTPIKKWGLVPYEFGQDPAERVFNSPQLIRARKAMAEGKPVRGCEICYASEAGGRGSYRLQSNRTWLEALGITEEEVVRTARERAFRLPHKPTTLHLNLGNLCNLRCRMCWAGNSSEIEADPVHARWAPPPRPVIPGKERIRRKREFFTDNLDAIRDVLGDTSELREIYFTGGEPTIMPSVRQMLEFLLGQGRTDIAIRLNTNATTVNAEFMALLARFRALTINFSIDGTGPTFEYIRFPARWDRVQANVLAIKAALPSATFHAMPTVQIYNLFNLAEMKAFCDGAGIEMIALPLHGPEYLAPTILPQSVRDRAAERAAPVLPMIAKYLREAPSTQSPQRLRRFMEFTNDLDRSRGQDVRAACPEVVAHLAEAGMPWQDATRFA